MKSSFSALRSKPYLLLKGINFLNTINNKQLSKIEYHAMATTEAI